MNNDDFKYWMERAAQWSAEYRATVGEHAVRSQLDPGDISAQIASSPPEAAHSMEAIFDDFTRIIPAGMTHWQHPRFFAYFPSNAAPPAVVAEVLATAIGAQCMLWQTSPAATELEVKMVDWLRQATGLPDSFEGVLQDTASSATLCAILTMREIALNFKGNEEGLFGQPTLRVYASAHTHSSIDKAMWIAGLGQANLVKISGDDEFAMRADELERRIEEDKANGYTPAGIIICVGGTSIGATDRVNEICAVAKRHQLFTHVDAAWAGSAMICSEYRYLWSGIEDVDSLVFNPHKWLGAPMECSAHFVKSPEMLVKTLAIQPEYLKTYGQNGIINFSEWGVQLGRRFRALKLWFLLRAYGMDGLRERIRNHVAWSQQLAQKLQQESDFEIVTAPILSLFSFRYNPDNETELDALNLELVNRLNDDGRIYLTQTTHNGQLVIRFQAGQFDMQSSDMVIAFDVIVSTARSL